MARRKGRLSNDSFAIAPVNFPTGSVLDFAGSTAPDGWLLCYGQAVSRADYASLFATLGETYGSGDGSTTFNLPDYRGRVIVGKDDMGGSTAGRMTTAGAVIDGTTLGASGGSQIHTLTAAQLASHNHTQDSHYHLMLTRTAISLAGGGTAEVMMSSAFDDSTEQSPPATATNNATAAGTFHQNTQPSIIANKIIKV